MDRKGISILVVAFGFLLLLPWLSRKIFPPTPGLPRATNGVVIVGGTNTPVTNIASRATLGPANPVTVATNLSVERGPERTLDLTNGSVRFVFTSHGGGLKHVELGEFNAFVPRRGTTIPDPTAPLRLNDGAPLPGLAFRDAVALEGSGEYELTRTESGVRAVTQVPSGLRITREFTLTTNEHLLRAVVRVENVGSQTLILPEHEIVVGTATPMNSHDPGDLMAVDWFNGSSAKQQVGWVKSPGMFCSAGGSRTEYVAGEKDVVWAAASSQFFTLVALPDAPAAQVRARRIPLPSPDTATLAADPRVVPNPVGVETVLAFGGVPVNAGQFYERAFTLYAGPKEYFALSRLQPEFDRVMGYGFFGFFAKPLLLGMNFLHGVLKLPYGWCIVAITVLIRIFFWPLTAVSTRSMKRMQELGPQLQAIREKYKDDPRKLNEKTMQFMRESGYNPLSGCLPMLVQIPVFIGFFTMLRSAIELRGASFFWCQDLSAADTLWVIPGLGWLPLFGVPGLGLPLNLMPLLYVATALWQTHLTPVSPQMDPAQQKMMRWMPLMFLALFYNYSAGLTLYWTAQNLLSILQTRLTRTVPAPATASAVATGARRRPGR